MKHITLFLIIFLLIGHQAWSATYYVKTGGNDSLSGLDDTNAWATISKVASTAASGDTVYFRSQDTWTGTPPLLTTTAGVTYDGSTYGSGTRATLQATSQGTRLGLVHIQSGSQADPVVFRGFKVDGNANSVGQIYIGYPSSSDISYITVDNCEATNTGIVDDTANNQCTANGVPWACCSANGVGSGTGECQQYYYGIIVSAYGSHTTSHVNITNNEVHHTGHEGLTSYPSWMQEGNKVDTLLIRGNNVYDAGVVTPGSNQPMSLTNDSDNITIEFNYIHDSGTGIVLSQYNGMGNFGITDNFIIRYNIIADTSSCFSLALNGSPLAYTGSGAFYGNICINGGIYLSYFDYTSSSMKFYNNTIYAPSCNNMCNGFYWSGGTTATNTVGIEFKNNIFSAGKPFELYGNEGFVHANNLYYGASNLVQYYYPSGTQHFYTSGDIAGWETTGVKTTNPTFTGGTLPTGFSGTYGVNMLPNQPYFAISTGDAIGNGATLGSPYNSAINYAGVATPLTRPAGAYDIGAYQYTGVGAYPPISGGLFIGGLLIQ